MSESCVPLLPEHRAFLAEEIARHIPRARDPNDPMQRAAKLFIDISLWCWTAYGTNTRGDFLRDGIKYDFNHQRHTPAAHERWKGNGHTVHGLRHEHAVPKAALVRHLLSHANPTPEFVERFLSRYCFAVVVTKEEGGRLNTKGVKSSMPPQWSFEDDLADPLARYELHGLKHDIRPPLTVLRGAG